LAAQGLQLRIQQAVAEKLRGQHCPV
jgi:hypothetical protein